MKEYRILKYYNAFFGHDSYLPQKKRRFLCWEWWSAIADDALGVSYYKWRDKFNCPIIDSKEIK